MKKWKVLVTRQIPNAGIELLEEFCDLDINKEDRPLTKEELMDKVKDKDGVLSLLNDSIDKDVIEAAKNCKIFANYAVGFNNIDLKLAKEKNILVTNTPGVLTDATADLAWALLFSCARRIPESDVYVRENKFKSWSPTLLLGMEITGKTLGIIGAGRIGQNFAKKAKAFNMNILYTSRTPKNDFEAETGATYVDKETLLKESDFIALHVPLTDDTYHLIGEKELKIMKNNAILINTSRGPVIDEKALVKALKERWIWSAGLDVYENEPVLEEGLMNLSNVVLLPHIGSATEETRDRMAIMAATNLLQGLRGETPTNLVRL